MVAMPHYATLYGLLVCCARWACDATPVDLFINESYAMLPPECAVSFANPDLLPEVEQLTESSMLVRYDFTFAGRQRNPLREGEWSFAYDASTWIHAPSSQAQGILNTAFSFFGIPPLVALTVVTRRVSVELTDQPAGCMDAAYETSKLTAVLKLLLAERSASVRMRRYDVRRRAVDEEVMCHQAVERATGRYAKFVIRCCYREVTAEISCYTNITEKWLRILDILLACVRLAGFLLGPVLIESWMYTIVSARVAYEVKLKVPLRRSVMVTRGDSGDTPPARRTIDLRHVSPRRFCHLRRAVADLPRDTVLSARVTQFDIDVDHSLLQTECQPPVSMARYMVGALFLCHSSQLGPLRDCCGDVVCGGPEPTRWRHVFRYVGRGAFVMLVLPAAFYVRFALFIAYEYPELVRRERAAAHMHMPMFPDHRLMHYLPAASYVFVSAYVVFVVGGVRLAYLSASRRHTKFQHAVEAAYGDMRRLDMLRDIGVALSRGLLPFRRCGVVGCLLAALLLPLLLPLYLLLSLAYCLPTVYLSVRIVRHVFATTPPDSPTGDACSSSGGGLFRPCRRVSVSLEHALTALITLLFLYSAMLLFSEVLGFVAELLCLILMGMVVQALKYASITFLVVMYGFDCYNSVTRRYSRLNADLFSVLRERLDADLSAFVSKPRFLRRHRAFKVPQSAAQAEYEQADDITDGGAACTINDLIMFVDMRDHPRIPRRLFEAVCLIDLPNSPGPPYRSMLQATGRFFVIVSFLAFVFAVVLSFGNSYNVSTLNQVLATIAGGILPFIFNSVLRLKPAETSALSVSFRCQLEEIIINFYQTWPMRDLRLHVDNIGSPTDSQPSPDFTATTATDVTRDVTGDVTKAPGDVTAKTPSHVTIEAVGDVIIKTEPRPSETATRPTEANPVDLLIRLQGDNWPVAYQEVTAV